MAVLGSIQWASSPRTLLTSVRQNLLYLNILGITLKCNTWTKTKKKSLHLRFVGMLSPIRDKVIITEKMQKKKNPPVNPWVGIWDWCGRGNTSGNGCPQHRNHTFHLTWGTKMYVGIFVEQFHRISWYLHSIKWKNNTSRPRCFLALI